MNTTDIIDVIEKLEARINNYWNFYLVAIVALVGWIISRGVGHVAHEEGLILAIGMGLFFFMNLAVLHPVTQRVSVFERQFLLQITQDDNISSDVSSTLKSTFIKNRARTTVATHLVMDTLVMLLIICSVYYTPG
ncbi:hypothetical protein [Gilvimarinus agarilyticus]|uniref:hypothetical protein n=1 Tax=Gilvimarinus agarilyticus TaxID=679259 RepID=UPI00059F3BFE|nr:hypothetical protein [Gilvimarinus agarilyticus]